MPNKPLSIKAKQLVKPLNKHVTSFINVLNLKYGLKSRSCGRGVPVCLICLILTPYGVRHQRFLHFLYSVFPELHCIIQFGSLLPLCSEMLTLSLKCLHYPFFFVSVYMTYFSVHPHFSRFIFRLPYLPSSTELKNK